MLEMAKDADSLVIVMGYDKGYDKESKQKVEIKAGALAKGKTVIIADMIFVMMRLVKDMMKKMHPMDRRTLVKRLWETDEKLKEKGD